MPPRRPRRYVSEMKVRITFCPSNMIIGFSWTDKLMRTTGWTALLIHLGPLTLILEKRRDVDEPTLG